MLQLLSFKRMHERYSGMYVCMHKCTYVFVHMYVRSCIHVHYRFLGLFNGFHQRVEAVLVIVDTFRKSPSLVRAWVSDACNPRVRARARMYLHGMLSHLDAVIVTLSL